ncbi:cytochrome P450 [Aspergillus karnatakaensis]|uniref:cytochrome P450 n=1 Tax=Aspergillus karnatakaensis TaxID=1810916 RepID=UPI003CCCEF42
MPPLLFLGALVALYIIYCGVSYIRSIYFHPLRHMPGPATWLAFPVLRYVSAVRGRLDRDMHRLHAQYGEAVRFTPNEVSFTTPEAWKDIYALKHPQLPKVVSSASPGIDIVSTLDDHDHARHRKALSLAFSSRGLLAQEPTIVSYVDKLIDHLKGTAESRQPTDMARWYNLTTFDIIGDLAFGQSFGGLDNSRYHHWVSTIFNLVKFSQLVKVRDAYPAFTPFLAALLSGRLLQAIKKQKQHTRHTVQRRLQQGSSHGRVDFMDSMLRHRGEKGGLTEQEIEANSSLLIVAGSETTASELSGVTYWLLRSPAVLAKVAAEVRSQFQTEAEINYYNVSTRLPYMLACLEEGLRMYPPVPTGTQRRVVSPLKISGYSIPAGTKVSVHQLSAYRSMANFHEPESFIPERWLPEGKNDPTSLFFSDRRDVLQPFSVGPRNCIGINLAYAEMRIVLARLLWNFDLELCEESQEWADQKSYALWDRPPLMSQRREQRP